MDRGRGPGVNKEAENPKTKKKKESLAQKLNCDQSKAHWLWVARRGRTGTFSQLYHCTIAPCGA